MARSSKSRGGGGSKSRSTASRKSTSRKTAAPAAVEVVDESSGMGIDDGVALVTTLILLAAILFVDYELGTEYGKGLFFK